MEKRNNQPAFVSPATGQLDFIGDNQIIEHNHLSLELQPDFLSSAQADALLDELIHTKQWQQPQIKVYGKWHKSPRLVQFVGDQNLVYKYSKTLHATQAWTPRLKKLKQHVEKYCEAKFNAVLLNYYRDGQDTMGWHADDEPELGSHPVIASLSVGATRDMHFKPKAGGELIKLSLNPGSLLLMRGETQKYWQHHIPKRLRCQAPRINMTFRMIYPL